MVEADGLPLRSLLDSAPDGFIVADAAGRVVWANQTAHTLFGYADGELAGRGIEELVPERLRRGHVAHRADYQAASRVRPMGLGLNLLGRKKDASEFPLEISLSPLQTPSGFLVTAAIRDVTERRRLEEERNLLALELETERERDRIAMDLHDGIMQDIYAAALTNELALADVDDERFADAAGVERAIDQLQEVVRSIRSYIFDLRPRQFAGNLAEALSNLAEEFGQNSQIETETSIIGEADLEPSTAVALYHIAHEGLSNIQRHAQAKHVSVTLSFFGRSGLLEIKDDGVGFDPSREIPESHHGMRNMAARVRSIHATLNVASAPGKGTRLSIDFPCPGVDVA